MHFLLFSQPDTTDFLPVPPQVVLPISLLPVSMVRWFSQFRKALPAHPDTELPCLPELQSPPWHTPDFDIPHQYHNQSPLEQPFRLDIRHNHLYTSAPPATLTQGSIRKI